MAASAVVSKTAMEYFDAIVQNGAFLVDSTGKGDLAPAVAEVVQALHEVLAGGRVQITVTTPGASATIRDLNAKKDAALAALNVVPASGGPIVFSP